MTINCFKTVSAKGLIYLPVALRRFVGIHEDDVVQITGRGGIILINKAEVMLSRLVDTFFSRTSWTMLLYAENHSISVA